MNGGRFGLMVSATAMVLAMAGCDSASVPVLRGDDGYGMTAAATGRLELEGGCLALVGPHQTYAVAWPEGTTWNPATSRVDVDGVSRGLGDEVTLVGGEFRPEEVVESEWLVLPSDGCRELGIFWRATQIVD